MKFEKKFSGREVVAPFIFGHPVYQPVMDVLGHEIRDEQEGFDLNLITYRVVTQTKSRTVADYWLTAIQPTNEILLNSQDASRLGLREGDKVKIVSKSNPEGMWDLKNGTLKPMIGEVKVIEGIRPGVVAVLARQRPLGLRLLRRAH